MKQGGEGEKKKATADMALSALSSSSSFPPGTVLKLTCSQGRELNSGKRRTRCRRGEWRPEASPRCRRPVGCRVPRAGEGGAFVRDLDDSILQGEGEIEHGASISIRCDQGFSVSAGPETRKCSFGEWVGGGAEMPRCVENP